MVATTRPMQEALARLRTFAPTDEPIVILGETGTGKTRLAEWVHRLSSRRTGPLHGINLGHLDDALAASELFGHIKGSFTDARERREGAFAAANGGTLFLDEMTKPRPGIQAKLLDFMETRAYRPVGADRRITVDVRLVFAANEEPESLVASGRMLPDFVARLGHFRIVLPPLRERRADIPALLHHSVTQQAPRFGYAGRPAPEIEPALEEALGAYDWPYNLRELDSLIRRLLVEAGGADLLRIHLLIGDLAKYRATSLPKSRPRGSRASELTAAIRACDGNKSRAARLLGISRATMNRECAALGREPVGPHEAFSPAVDDARVSQPCS